MKKYLLVFAFLLSAFPCYGASTNVDCSSVSNMATAITNASSGDTLTCTASGTWATGATIPNTKGLTLNGGGYTITMGGNATLITIQPHATTQTRITNFVFTLSQARTGIFVYVDGDAITDALFRIDNNTFTDPGTGCNGASPGVLLTGNFIKVLTGYGLIDNNTFNGASAAEHIHIYGYGPADTTGWTTDVVQANQVFIEDNTFNNSCLWVSGGSAYTGGNSAIQAYYGARVTFRYNVLTMSGVDVHGTPGSIGGRWWEIYNNEFKDVANSWSGPGMGLRAGSGVVFGNTWTTVGNGAGGISLQEEDSGECPLLYQIGRGKNQALDPAYFWNNNGKIPGVSGDGAACISLNTDYYNSAKGGYSAYTYPHPLQDPAPTTYALTLTVVGTATSVISSPPGILSSTSTSANFDSGTSVTLTAKSGTGFWFAGWSGDCSGTTLASSVTMAAAKACTATFRPNTVTLGGTGTATLGGTGVGVLAP
jgi:hypothetical protein